MEKEVVWHGDSLEIVRRFPDKVRRAVGTELRRLRVPEEIATNTGQ